MKRLKEEIDLLINIYKRMENLRKQGKNKKILKIYSLYVLQQFVDQLLSFVLSFLTERESVVLWLITFMVFLRTSYKISGWHLDIQLPNLCRLTMHDYIISLYTIQHFKPQMNQHINFALKVYRNDWIVNQKNSNRTGFLLVKILLRIASGE
jgi:hypothetical protein